MKKDEQEKQEIQWYITCVTFHLKWYSWHRYGEQNMYFDISIDIDASTLSHVFAEHEYLFAKIST